MIIYEPTYEVVKGFPWLTATDASNRNTWYFIFAGWETIHVVVGFSSSRNMIREIKTCVK